ncbi:MAG: bifunctional folylpolyglutamate synthase/dihydrofolate synthase [Paludibacteraceae bacterium]|nr:bifunctional folylpolyglutamate synthase/dihydrofolate synthase [Paludibacteraceae bacterium]
MTYSEAIRYLYDSAPAFHLVGASAYKPGLDNVLALMEQFGNPHTKFRSIHVAGTNGKGSTSHLIAAVLQAAGYKVGLYTSPHLVDFRERIRINGQMIPEERVVAFVEQIKNPKSKNNNLQSSFFELTTALAFSYFAEQQVDIAVVEVGLGGRLDATNIITPLLSVITNIGLDHTEFLGHTLKDIAREKAGIIKPGVPCVIGETDDETEQVFIEAAKQNGLWGEGLETTNCRIWFADQCGYMRKRRLREAPTCQLQGLYQDKNQQTAYVALQVLRNYTPITYNLSSITISEGFAKVCTLTGLRGRWEILRDKPLTICDTGHNSHSIKYVAEQLHQLQITSGKSQLHVVFGMVNDKDVDVVLKLLPQDAHYYFTQAQTHRAIPAAELQAKFGAGEVFSTVAQAVQAAQKEATDEDIIFIGGSNYVVGEALTLF